MASNPITKTNLANYIPSIWSQEVLAATENNLVIAPLVDRSYEGYAAVGNKIVVPNLANISANAANTAADMTLYDTVQNVTNIDIDKYYDIGVAVDDFNQIQTNPKYFSKVRDKLAYGLAVEIDSSLAALFSAFSTNTAGTEGSALTIDVMIACYECLNEQNAPSNERAWIFDPESITDLMGIDYFVRMDYVPDSVSKNGFVGRQIFGAPVYMTTNLTAINTSYHAATYIQREALALVLQMPPKFEVARLPLRHSDALIGECMWGVKEMRDAFGVWIKTRS